MVVVMSELERPGPELESLAHSVIGAALAVHRALGPGHLESVYVNALKVELDAQGIPYRTRVRFQVEYRDVLVGGGEIDILVGECLVVEAKAVSSLIPYHLAQTLSYLKAGGYRLGLLINFQVAFLKEGIRRVIRA